MRSRVACAVAWLAVACSSPPPTEPLELSEAPAPREKRSGAPAPAPTPSASTSSAPAPSESGSSAVPAAPPDASSRTWRGTLATTATTDFGGDPYCAYRVTLRQLAVELSAMPNGKIVSASVTAEAVEEAVPPCPYAPTPANDHGWELASWTVLASGVTRVTLAPLAKNRPAASLVLEIDLEAAAPEASLEWHRTDVSPPLDWRAAAAVPLSIY